MKKTNLIPVLALALAAGALALPAAAQNHGPNYNQNNGQNHGPNHNQNNGQNQGPRHGPNHSQANWQNINQRQANLDRRIDQGVRNGTLSRREATRLRSEFNALARLEQNYRRGGLTQWERADLDRRFDRLSVEVRQERRDRDNRRG